MKAFIQKFLFLLTFLLLGRPGLTQSSITPNSPGTITTYSRLPSTYVNGTSATTQALGYPRSVAAATDGGFYIASPDEHRVYRVRSNGQMFLIAGSLDGFSGDTGDGGPATSALLRFPSAIAVDSSGNVFISDAGNSRIRKIDSDGVITTVAMNVASARGLAVDSANNLYVAEAARYRILKFSPAGVVTVAAGKGISGFSGDGGPATAAALSIVDGIATDAAGNLYIADVLNNRVRKVNTLGIITTVAGNGTGGFAGDGGSAASGRLYHPEGVATDAAGNLYIADYFNHAIRKVTPAGVISTVTGGPSGGGSITGTTVGGFGGDGGPAVRALLKGPIAVASDAAGNLYIADSGNYRVRQVKDGVIRTTAGNGTPGGSIDSRPSKLAVDMSGNLYVIGLARNVVHKIAPNGRPVLIAGTGTYGYGGDGGPAGQAQFASPADLAVDGSGNLYIADSANHRIRKISSNGIISTVAGNGTEGFSGDGGPATAARLSFPSGVTVDSAGNLYISDSSNYRVRKVTPNGIITTIAGNGTAGYAGDGIAVSVPLGSPSGLALDLSGALLIADSNNQRVRKLTGDGVIRTIAGDGNAGFNADGPALSARLFTPSSLAVDSTGNVYVADTNNERVRKITPNGTMGQDFAYFIPPRGSQTFQTSAPATSSVTVGNVRVIGSPASGATPLPAAIAIFSYRNNGITVAETGVPTVPAGTAFRTLYGEFGRLRPRCVRIHSNRPGNCKHDGQSGSGQPDPDSQHVLNAVERVLEDSSERTDCGFLESNLRTRHSAAAISRNPSRAKSGTRICYRSSRTIQ